MTDYRKMFVYGRSMQNWTSHAV